MRDAPEQTWTPQELDRIEDADEMGIASRRADGSLRSFITIWFVRGGDGLYVRSAHGPRNAWFRRALASGHGRVRVGNWEHDVAFKVPDAAVTGDELHRASTPSTTTTVRGSWTRSCPTWPRIARCGSCPARRLVFFAPPA